MQLQYLRSSAVDQLYERIDENAHLYTNAGANFSELWGDADLGEISGVQVNETLLRKLESDKRRDFKNARHVYLALKGMTPYLARKEGIWTYLTHGPCLNYARGRWLRSGEAQKNPVVEIQKHFFVRAKYRPLTDANAVSSLWWRAHIMNRYTGENVDQRKLLKVLLHKRNVTSSIIFRSGTMRSPEVFSAIMDVLVDCYDSDSERQFFRRRSDKPQVGPYNFWLKEINRQGGVRLLSALSRADMKELFSDLAVKAEKDFNAQYGPIPLKRKRPASDIFPNHDDA